MVTIGARAPRAAVDQTKELPYSNRARSEFTRLKPGPTFGCGGILPAGHVISLKIAAGSKAFAALPSGQGAIIFTVVGRPPCFTALRPNALINREKNLSEWHQALSPKWNYRPSTAFRTTVNSGERPGYLYRTRLGFTSI